MAQVITNDTNIGGYNYLHPKGILVIDVGWRPHQQRVERGYMYNLPCGNHQGRLSNHGIMVNSSVIRGYNVPPGFVKHHCNEELVPNTHILVVGLTPLSPPFADIMHQLISSYVPRCRNAHAGTRGGP